jgi:hypothetical protein
MATVTTSKRGTLNTRDFLRGLLITVITAALTTVLTMLEAEDLVIKWKTIGIAGLAAGISYLLKNLLSPGEIVITNPAPATMEAIKQGTAEVKVETK